VATRSEPVYFFSTLREKRVTRGLDALLKFHMIDQETRDSLLDLFYEGQDEDKKIVEAIISSHVQESEERVRELEQQVMDIRLKNDPNYQKGYFMGTQIIPHIAKTSYITLEGAVEKKKKEVDDLRAKFQWTNTHKEIAEKLGLIAAWEDELSIKNNNS
jgi:hypothetical protein